MKKHLVIIHGYTGHNDSFKTLIFLIKKSSPDVIIHNLLLPGHGTDNAINLSTVNSSDFIEFVEKKLLEIKNNNPEDQIVLFAHSYGGAISTQVLAKNPDVIESFISLNIAIWKVPLWMKIVAYLLPFFQNFKPWYYLDESNKTELGNIKDIVFSISRSYQLYRKTLPKNLIILGKNDDAINPHFSRHLNKINPNSRIIEVEDFSHLPGNDEIEKWTLISNVILKELGHNQE